MTEYHTEIYASVGPLLKDICTTFLDLWTEHRKVRRLTVPFLQTAQRLLAADEGEEENPLNSDLAGARPDIRVANYLRQKGSLASTVYCAWALSWHTATKS